MNRILFGITICLCTIGCRSESTVESSTSTQTETQTSQTSVKFNVVNSQSVPQKDIVVMMFKTKVTSASNLPPIEKQVVSDNAGVAHFDLASYISSNIAATYYFEAFKKNGGNYTWVSTTHPELSIKKGQQITTSIVVN